MATYGIDKYVYVLANTAVELLGTSPTLRLDDSVIEDPNAELITYLGDLSGDTPLDTSATEDIQFVGWSFSNTYASSPASSTENVSSVVLSSLSFSDLSSSSVTNTYPVFQYYTSPSSTGPVDPGGTFSSSVPLADFYDSVDSTTNQGGENKLVRKALTKLPEPFLSGLKLAEDVEINGLTLNKIEDPTVANGYSEPVIWVVEDIDGWWTLPDSEVPDLPRGWGDGSYDAVGRFATRNITLTGSFLTQSPDDAPLARNALMNAITLIKTGGWLKVQETSGNPRAAYVRLQGTPLIASVNARGRHAFSIGLKAVDPIKYEFVDSDPNGYNYLTLTAAGDGTATGQINNTGNTEVPVIIEFPLGMATPASNALSYVTNTTRSEYFRIITGTDSDTRLEADTYNREVLEVQYDVIGGVIQDEDNPLDVSNGRAKAEVLPDWIYLSPGVNNIGIANFTSGDVVKILYRSGWIG